jgi:excinuclease ABC subunit A
MAARPAASARKGGLPDPRMNDPRPPVAALNAIRIRGARQNNLKNLDVEIPTGELVVVTGVSGSGKSSLVFDTLYAEGQRRYVETFSPYARQFLDRMDKPQVDAIEGIPPAIAIDQTNPVRTSRSTVGTMTELNDHLKLLFARAATLYCRGCGQPVRRDTPDSIFTEMQQRSAAAGDPRLVLAFPITVPANFREAEVKQLLEQQGYTRIHAQNKNVLDVVQDRFRLPGTERSRVMASLEAALRVGQGRVNIFPSPSEGEGVAAPHASPLTPHSPWKFSTALHCPDCDIHYHDPIPSSFSFNSPVGACEACRGFGRVIGIDYGLIVPDESKTLREGAVKPWQTPSNRECQDDLVKYAKKRGIPLDTPWRRLTPAQKTLVLEGEPEWVSWRKSWPGVWYGVARFFKWLESKAYKMHVRVLLSKYRAYTPCTTCNGARLKTEPLLWRIGTRENADRALAGTPRFRPAGVQWNDATLAAMPGLTVHDLMLLPIERVQRFFGALDLPAAAGSALDEATALLFAEIRARLGYLDQVGLAYLTLDRQSRTLSGGEVQRINLTTALGTSLVNTLFVLDEPSIGLHPRDMGRVIGVMKKLRDAGNSLVVVEHDPQIMLEADRVMDMGPGPGERGGEVVFFGTPDGLKSARTLTADYLSGRKRADDGGGKTPARKTGAIKLTGASGHNLKNIDVEFPLNRLVCVTGVSGSGKSTLVQDVLYAALLKAKGKPTEVPGAHRELQGAEQIADVVMVDQTPIGRTTRSNPASYVGAFDAIRNQFAFAPESRSRGYTPGTFSFNAGNGRCPACGGNGFEHVEMQFLSDVYLRCPDCDGKRFRAEILEVLLRGKSIADVLEMTVTEALAFFAGDAEVHARLAPLSDVGLDYLRLGQPVPTLSGGEAQRLKLAGFLAEAAAARVLPGSKLFLFDEPTTGLHFDDVAKLLRALRKLLAVGHSLIVIEHNLDVIRAADWIVDLGPEGGDAGGELVCAGTPAEVRAHATSHTGKALREYELALTAPSPSQGEGGDGGQRTAGANGAHPHPSPPPHRGRENSSPHPSLLAPHCIHVHNAREHNLKNIDVEIPRNRFTVVTGVSGSGKSTLAFDLIFAEGQRRYLESLNAYARQFVQPATKPDVDAIFGIPPTVAIEQRTSRGGRKSTVATLTEIYHFLRLLFVKLGTQYCPDCNVPIEPQTADAIVARLMKERRGEHIGLLAPLIVSRKGYYTDLAKWALGKGYTHLRVDGAFLPTTKWPRLDRFKEHTIELPVADLVVTPANEAQLRAGLATALEHGKGVAHIAAHLEKLKKAITGGDVTGATAALKTTVFSTRRACPSCGTSFAELDPRLFSFNSRHGWCGTCYGTGLRLSGFDEEQSGEEVWWNAWYEGETEPCPDCHGERLNPVARNVRLRQRSIAEVTKLPVGGVAKFFGGLDLRGRDAEIARDMLAEIRSRLSFLEDVGLGYLALDRAAPTLSGGEAQRIRLAAQLGSNLQGVCYILDEPTIGLHPRDNRILLDTLDKLERKGNTLLVVEHDEDTIRRAHHVIDLGPGAGKLGGYVTAEGTAEELMRSPTSLTGRFLRHPLKHPLQPRRTVKRDTPVLEISGARLHNLQKANVRVPLSRLTVVTGVSGSGKSTLARDVLFDNLKAMIAPHGHSQAKRTARGHTLIGCEAITGWEAVGRVLEVDQTPIGKTPRSCPATYVGFWDAIRRLFAETSESRLRGYTPSRFSFNTKGGRCEACEGQGVKTIEMSFLPDVKMTCDVCGGQRFDPETLAVRFKGKSIGEVLMMSVDEAVDYFSAHPSIHHALTLLQDVGLGYLTLGQQSPTLSGGEAQRIKLVTELSKVRTNGADAAARPGRAGAQKHTLYVLDEPTVGLHMADVEKLIRVLHRLVDAGNTVVLIEHNLDIMAEADWIVDLGPEGGDAGGRVVAQGAPEAIVKHTDRSHTARVLGNFLAERSA